jgi:cytochrome P450
MHTTTAPHPASVAIAPTDESVNPRLRQIDDLPGPRGLPLLGNSLQTRPSRLHLDVERWAGEFGPLFRFSVGPIKALGVSDHRLVTEILRDRPHRFRRAVMMQEIAAEMGLKTGLFHAEGQAWQNQRRMIMSSFSPANVRAYFPALLKVGQRLQARWGRAVEGDKGLELLPELMRFTVDIISGLAFGSDTNTLESGDDIIQSHLDKIFPAMSRRMNAPLPYWRYIALPADRALARSVPAVNEAIAGFISTARQRLTVNAALRAQPSNLLEAMIVAADEPGSGVNDDDVAGNVLTMLLAGEDTTASTIAWLIHLLHRHPQAMARVKAELRAVAPSFEALTPEQVNAMPFLDACINETMRLKPVAPLNPLEAVHDTTIGDVHVPAGTFVACVMRTDALSEANFSEADRFHPQRWMQTGDAVSGESASAHDKRASMPWGAGPRICPGRYLALLEIKVAVAALLSAFDIESLHAEDGAGDGAEPREIMTFAMHPSRMTLKLRRRAKV